MTRNHTCICCPLGCQITIEFEEEIISVEGNSCQRGKEYAKSEVTSPVRVFTSSVRVMGGNEEMCSVKSSLPLPKDRILDVAEAIRNTVVEAPIEIGDIMVPNVLETGVDLIATRKVEKRQ